MTNIKDAPETYSFPEIVAPTTPPTGKVYIYAKTDGNMYQKDDAGVETALAGGGGGIGGSTGATDNAIIRADGIGGATVQAGSGVTLDDSARLAGAIIFGGPTYLNRISVDSTITDKTLSGNALTPSTARYIRVSSQTGASSLDQIDSIATTNMSTGEEILLVANTNHFVDIRHAFGGGNVRLTSGTSLRLSESVPLRLILDSSGNFVEGLYTLASSGASTALDNLASVAVNTDIISDTDSTDNLGSSAKKWLNVFTDATVLGERSAPSTPASGDLILYANTDGKAVSLNDGGVSRILGVMTEIVPATELGSSQTTITLSSIPDDFEDLILVVKARSTAGGTDLRVTFNADTGANYTVNYLTIGGTGTLGSVASNNQSNMNFDLVVSASTDTANYFGYFEMRIGAYTESSKTRSGFLYGHRWASATVLQHRNGSFAWENVSAAISSIELNLSAGDFATGTIYALYGIGTAV